MIIDMHVHERTHSDDSILSLDEIVSRARQMGLDGVCITDHESNGLRDVAYRMSRATGFPIFVGAEILTDEGDLLVFGLERIPSEQMSAEQLLKRVEQAGGAAISAHPFRRNNRGMGQQIRPMARYPALTGVEVLNGSTPYQHNCSALEIARQTGLSQFGGSDAHHVRQLGQYATRFPDRVRSGEDLVRAIRAGATEAVIFHHGRYRSMDWTRGLTGQAVS